MGKVEFSLFCLAGFFSLIRESQVGSVFLVHVLKKRNNLEVTELACSSGCWKIGVKQGGHEIRQSWTTHVEVLLAKTSFA